MRVKKSLIVVLAFFAFFCFLPFQKVSAQTFNEKYQYNLFDKSLIVEDSYQGYFKYNNGFMLEKKLTGTRSFYIDLPNIIPANTTITISYEKAGTTVTRNAWGGVKHTDNTTTSFAFNSIGTFTYGKPIKSIRFIIDGGDELGSLQYFDNFQIEYGSTASEYVPFHTYNDIAFKPILNTIISFLKGIGVSLLAFIDFLAFGSLYGYFVLVIFGLAIVSFIIYSIFGRF